MMYDSVSREVLYSILNEFGIHMKLIRPIKFVQMKRLLVYADDVKILSEKINYINKNTETLFRG
jgi:hypothetical protein